MGSPPPTAACLSRGEHQWRHHQELHAPCAPLAWSGAPPRPRALGDLGDLGEIIRTGGRQAHRPPGRGDSFPPPGSASRTGGVPQLASQAPLRGRGLARRSRHPPPPTRLKHLRQASCHHQICQTSVRRLFRSRRVRSEAWRAPRQSRPDLSRSARLGENEHVRAVREGAPRRRACSPDAMPKRRQRGCVTMCVCGENHKKRREEGGGTYVCGGKERRKRSSPGTCAAHVRERLRGELRRAPRCRGEECANELS